MAKYLASIPFGRLDGDPARIAAAVLEACRETPIVVWADHLGGVFGELPVSAQNVPHDWVIGRYQGEAECTAIEDDLLAYSATRVARR